MKRITLELDAEMYSVLYTGIIASECELSRKELRAIGRVTDAVEAIGIKQDDGNFVLDALKGNNGSITLDKYDLDVLNKVISAVKWRPFAARKLARLFDILDSERDEE